ncbi:MAG: DeoR/GlpR family DNA-binding transcription regulator [Saccharofermentanales bacterium]
MMFTEERRNEIESMLKDSGRVSANDLSEKFNVSLDTVRRDLIILEKRKLLKRTHGGAIPLRQVAFGIPPKFTVRDITEIKRNYFAIAMKAISMIQDNDVIFITSASVGYFMAQNIPKGINLRVVTNSILIADELRKNDSISTILLGGEMDSKGNCYDAFAVDMINHLRFDKCFITSACISPDFGLSIQKTIAINFYNAVINSSKMTVGLFPTEKIGFDSIVSICPASKLDFLITDWDASRNDIAEFEELGINVIVSEEPSL